MTDTERERIDAICKVAKVKDIGDLSDGFHTFNSLYYQRMILFYPKIALDDYVLLF